MTQPEPQRSRAASIWRERRFAAAALAHFGLAGAPYRLLSLSHLAKFRVTAHDGYLLRLHRPGWHSPAMIESELHWLTTLRQQTPLLVPEPVVAPDGRWLVELALPGEQERRYAAMLRWLPGRRKLGGLAASDSKRFGWALGTLHRAAASFAPPPAFVRHDYHTEIAVQMGPVLDLYGPPLLAPDELHWCEQALAHITAHLGQLGRAPDSFGLIHADTNLSNVLYTRDQVALIDFDVCCFGYYLYDVVRSLDELAAHERSELLIKSFYTGYQQQRELPPFDDRRMRLFRLINSSEVVRWLLTTPAADSDAGRRARLRATIRHIQQLLAA